MRYVNLAALQAAYKSGELGEDDLLIVDNDTFFVYAGDDCVWEHRGAMEDVLFEALELLGIPADGA